MRAMPTIFPVTGHTKQVGQGTTFVAIQGQREDGNAYIPQALAQGAQKIVIQNRSPLSADLVDLIEAHQASLVYVENSRLELARLSAAASEYAAKKLKIIGVTGTKGKTSTTFILEHLLRSSGYKTALLGTVKNFIDGQYIPGELTTPQPDHLHQFFVLCVEAKIDYVIMEVAAQAITLHRVHGIEFEIGVFTNFSQEHGEFYATQEDYFAAKKEIISYLKQNATLLVNADDQQSKKLLEEKNTVGFSLVRKSEGMIASCIVEHRTQKYILSCPALIGIFNCYNVLAAASVALQIGLLPENIQDALQKFPGVPGRLERYPLPNGSCAIIDYAHNPSSFRAVLSTLRHLTPHLLVVFGCGGDRDATKRPIMGALAVQYADLVILTTDNPRSENPYTILEAMYAGIPQEMRTKVCIEPDREKAIRQAYVHSSSQTILALLGKGPDEYQQIGSIKYPFSEKQILQTL